LGDNDLGIEATIVIKLGSPVVPKETIDKINNYLKGKIKTSIEFDWTKKALNAKLSEMRTYLKESPLKVEIQTYFNQGALNAQLAGLQNQINKVGLNVGDSGSGGYVTYPASSEESGSSGTTSSGGSYNKKTTYLEAGEEVRVIEEYNRAIGDTYKKTIEAGEATKEAFIEDKNAIENAKKSLELFITKLTNTKKLLQQKVGSSIDTSSFDKLIANAQKLNTSDLGLANSMKAIQSEASKLTGTINGLNASLNALNKIDIKALKTQTGIQILPKELPGQQELLQKITAFREKVNQMMSNVPTTGIVSEKTIRDLNSYQEKLQSLYRLEKENAKDSQGFTYQKYEAFTKLNPAITDVTSKYQLENKALIENARLIRSTTSETENFIKVSQQLLQGSTKKDLTVYIDKNKLADGTNQIYKVNESLRDLKVRAWDVGSVFKEAFQKVGLWAGATGLFYGVANSIQQVWVQIVEVNKQFIELSKVSGGIANWNDIFQDTALNAQYYAKSLTNAVQSSVDFARQGYSVADAIKMTSTAMLTANVANMTVSESSEKLIGILSQFDVSVQNSTNIVDKLSMVDLQFATTTQQIMAGLTKSGATMEEYGYLMAA